jgi:sialic acid synthase SpsE
MIEILNEKFPEEISFNILKFMSHPTADIIKPEIDKVLFNITYYEDDKPLYMFNYSLHFDCDWLQKM